MFSQITAALGWILRAPCKGLLAVLGFWEQGPLSDREMIKYMELRREPEFGLPAALVCPAASDWSLNPGRYVGVAPGLAHNDEEFRTKLETLQEQLESLNAEAAQLQTRIAQNVAELLDK